MKPHVGYHAPSGAWRPMIDREKVLAVLRKRFAGAPAEQIAAAANAIVGLSEEWHEVSGFEQTLLRHAGESPCDDPACFIERLRHGGQFKLLERVGD
jgi:hypothetical protein